MLSRTGYRGEPARRVWRTIYRENCFFSDVDDEILFDAKKSSLSSLRDLCMEKRTFYRLISGLHSSINIHLSANYLFRGGEFRPNLKEFHRRFDAELTHGQGPLWLTNLYFAYLVELRALQKAGAVLQQYEFYTGVATNDADVRQSVANLSRVIDSFNAHFDESLLFNGIADGASSGGASESAVVAFSNNNNLGSESARHAQQLFDEFRTHFQNVSRIMDCVGCDKCKLWGKLQVQGMGTALRILYHDLTTTKNGEMSSSPPLQLRRNEIISLFNAFGKLSQSIEHLLTFRSIFDDAETSDSLPNAKNVENLPSKIAVENDKNSHGKVDEATKNDGNDVKSESEEISSPPCFENEPTQRRRVFTSFFSDDYDRTLCWTFCALGLFVIVSIVLCFVGGRRCFFVGSSSSSNVDRKRSRNDDSDASKQK